MGFIARYKISQDYVEMQTEVMLLEQQVMVLGPEGFLFRFPENPIVPVGKVAHQSVVKRGRTYRLQRIRLTAAFLHSLAISADVLPRLLSP